VMKWWLMRKRIFFYFFWHDEDVINQELNHEATEALAKIIEKYKPYGFKMDLYYTGLIAKGLKEKKPELVKYLKSLNMPLAYHGDIHVTEFQRRRRTPRLRWDEEVKAAIEYETHDPDPMTGELNLKKIGGLIAVQEVFGKRISACVGAGGAHLYARKKLIAAGRPIAIMHATYPEPAWYMGCVAFDNHHIPNLEMFNPYELSQVHFFEKEHPCYVRDVKKTLKKMITEIPEDEVAIIALPVHPYNIYATLAPAGAWKGWAYYRNNPRWREWMDKHNIPASERGSPSYSRFTASIEEAKLPSFLLRSEEERKEALERWESLVRYVVMELIPNNPEMGLITGEDLVNMVIDDRERTLSPERIYEAAEFLLINWDEQPPAYIDFGDDYLSLSDVFQALTCSLTYYAKYGMLPEVRTWDILGPTEEVEKHVLEGTVPGENLLSTVASIEINDRVPAAVRLKRNGTELNAAELLYIMAQEYKGIWETKKPVPVKLKGSVIFPAQVQLPPHREKIDRARLRFGQRDLQMWTFKPCRWKNTKNMN